MLAAAPYNVGIAMGPANLVVVDLDMPKGGTDTPPTEWAGAADGLDVFAMLCERAGERLPTETYTVRTRRGGQHLYCTAPTRKRLRSTANAVGWKGDTRAWGRVRGCGRQRCGRSVVRDHSRRVTGPLPAWLSDLLTPKPAPAPMPCRTAIRVSLRLPMSLRTPKGPTANGGALQRIAR
ncbi:bifunctional DNA primase/polymerase [Streptomyces sp. NPDC002458]|uniref:bifunctional DNA primase/polymerase n=1 Tax=Streptomyces sp. NPDC002458 TaxID=3364644 RepID=UPI0036C64654